MIQNEKNNIISFYVGNAKNSIQNDVLTNESFYEHDFAHPYLESGFSLFMQRIGYCNKKECHIFLNPEISEEEAKNISNDILSIKVDYYSIYNFIDNNDLNNFEYFEPNKNSTLSCQEMIDFFDRKRRNLLTKTEIENYISYYNFSLENLFCPKQKNNPFGRNLNATIYISKTNCYADNLNRKNHWENINPLVEKLYNFPEINSLCFSEIVQKFLDIIFIIRDKVICIYLPDSINSYQKSVLDEICRKLEVIELILDDSIFITFGIIDSTMNFKGSFHIPEFFGLKELKKWLSEIDQKKSIS